MAAQDAGCRRRPGRAAARAAFLFYLACAIFFSLGADARAWEMYAGRNLVVYVRQIEPGSILLVSEDKTGDKNNFAIRFYGIGIPSARQPFGQQARAELLRLLPPGQKILITTVNEDPNGIINALVQLDERSINNRLVEEGLAWVDRSTCKAFFCRRWHIQESLAIRERRGVWSLNIPTPPWQWGELP